MNSRNLKITVYRLTYILAIFTIVFIFTALESFAVEGPVLTVKFGDKVKTYDSVDTLASIPNARVESLDYSGYNAYPTFSKKHLDEGVRLDRIIEDATGKDITSFDENSVIKLTALDTVTASFTFGQLFGCERYYFPNASAGTNSKGGKAFAEAYTNAVKVCAAIETKGDNTLMFGQAAPNDQNYPECLKYMLYTGGKRTSESIPQIEIFTDTAEKCTSAQAVPADGATVSSGTKISLPLPATIKEARTKIYYIIDPASGEEPGYGCDFYYYAANRWNEGPEKFTNPPVITGTGNHVLAVKVCAYGKQDSDVTYFRYTVQDGQPVPAKVTKPGKTAVTLKSGKRMIKVSWKKVNGADGYVIYRSTKKTSGFKAVKTIKKGSTVKYTNKKLKKGKRYYYKVRAYINDGGEKIYGEYSKVKSVKAK